MRTAPGFALALILGSLTGCATVAAPAPDAVGPSAAHIAALEAEFAEDSTNLEIRTQLGAAYAATSRPEQAFPLLWDASIRDPESAPVLLYLALTFEELGQFAQARIHYERFLALGPPANVADPVRDRLPWVRRQELEVKVIRALALEDSLVANPAPHSVGVFPFVYQGTDPSFEPLGRALAHMLTTDLGQVDRITVLERVETQMMLDELSAGQTEYVDPITAARGGRILGAGRIVQGRIEGSEADLGVEATVVPVEDPGAARTVNEQAAGESLFELEARLAFAIIEALGVELAPAERDRIARSPTTSMDALLAFGRGLVALDGGDFTTAATEMSAAAQFDPGFVEAQVMGEEAQAMEAASGTSTNQVAATNFAAMLGSDALDAVASADAPAGLEARRDLFRDIEQIIPDITTRDPVAEVTGLEGFGGGAPILDVIIRRPARLR